jgi:hypothetical protein
MTAKLSQSGARRLTAGGQMNTVDRLPYNLAMIDLGRLLERTAFHIPYSHDWLAERDALRNERHRLQNELGRLQGDLDRTREELITAQKRIAEMTALFQPPGHFYSPIPDISDLQANWEKVFRIPRSIPDVEINEQHQLELLDQFQTWYAEQPFTETRTPERRYYFENENFSYTDAIILYCMMRRLRPRKIVEVGSGFSSCAMLDVNDRFFDHKIEFTFIEPYPELLFSLMSEADREQTKVLASKVQDVDLEVFQALGSNDILFIDSSHVSKTGSDVNDLLFRILPILNEGVHIHFHDIFFPFEYPDSWAFEGRAWNEVYLLHAFLAHNRAYQIEFFNTYVVHNHRVRIGEEFPLFLKNMGGSLWLRKNART